jgi:hypothetical protein
VFARGLTEPIALAWDTASRLWTAGAHLSAPQVAYVGGNREGVWPQPLAAAAVDPSGTSKTGASETRLPAVVLRATAETLVRCDSASPPSCSAIAVGGGTITAAVTSSNGVAYVAVAHDDGMSIVLELHRAD